MWWKNGKNSVLAIFPALYACLDASFTVADNTPAPIAAKTPILPYLGALSITLAPNFCKALAATAKGVPSLNLPRFNLPIHLPRVAQPELQHPGLLCPQF